MHELQELVLVYLCAAVAVILFEQLFDLILFEAGVDERFGRTA